MSQKKKNSILTSIKMVVFLIIIFAIARVAMIFFANGKINALEGYLYSFAATATSSDATSCDATSSDATSSNATSSNATSCNATSSNATSCDATSSNATISNVSFYSKAIKQQHLQEIQQVVEEKIAPINNTEKKETVSFLESHKTYVVIIGVCALGILLVAIIIALDKRGIKKRKMKATQQQNNENIPKAFRKDDE